jgi:hypothetical protein
VRHCYQPLLAASLVDQHSIICCCAAAAVDAAADDDAAAGASGWVAAAAVAIGTDRPIGAMEHMLRCVFALLTCYAATCEPAGAAWPLQASTACLVRPGGLLQCRPAARL